MGWNGKKLLKPTPEALESFSPAPFVFKHKVACHLKKIVWAGDLVVVAAHLNCQPALPYCLPGYSTKFLDSPKGKS